MLGKIQPFSVLILGIVSFVSVYSHLHDNEFVNDEFINSIIQKHWNKHVDSLPPLKRAELLNSDQENNMRFATKANQPCRHDQLFTTQKDILQRGLLDILSKRDVNQIQSLSFNSSIPYNPIRFSVDNTQFTSNDVRACYTVGSTVILGSSDSTRPCRPDNTGDFDNCVYTCTSEDILSTSLQNIFKNSIIPAVLEIFEGILRVQRVEGNLLLNQDIWEIFNQQCSDDLPLSANFVSGLGEGIPNADMLVIGTARPCGNKNIVAYAKACNFDWDGISTTQGFGRPLAGTVNFCPRYYQEFSGSSFNLFDFSSMIKVGVHEFTHALGFDSLFYKSYIDKSTGKPHVAPVNTKLREGTNPSGDSFRVTITSIATPNVIATARSHYGCDALDGVELEDFGGAGTAGSHWELRIANVEYMTGVINPVMPVSYLTLSLFNDMGWYEANLTKSQYWAWGKDQGCNWVTGRCESTWNGPGYFCTSSNDRGCSADRIGKGFCNLGRYVSALPPYYQHFTDPTLGGNSAADFCTFFAPIVFCANSTQTPIEGLFESYGNNSLCFSVGKNSQSITNYGCYQYTCNSQTSLSVTVGNEVINCPQAGGNVASTTLGGVIECPSASLVCRGPATAN